MRALSLAAVVWYQPHFVCNIRIVTYMNCSNNNRELNSNSITGSTGSNNSNNNRQTSKK